MFPVAQDTMGGRGSDVGSSTIAFIHASDGEQWAYFLQRLLKGPDYNIETTLHPPNAADTSQLFSPNQTCAVLVSPSMLEGGHTDFWQNCVDSFHTRTVVLLLGVDQNDLKEGLGGLADRVLRHKWLEMDGSRQAVTGSLVKLIEAYEAVEYTSSDKSDYQDDDDVYDRPPPPRQQNGVIKVIPSVLYEQSNQELVVVLARQVDGTVALVTEGGGGPSQHIAMEHITGSAYSAKLNSLHGKVSFTVLSGEHILGNGSVDIQSRLEQLACILRSEISPLTLMCSAMGVSTARRSEAEELDTVLAAKLAGVNLPLGLTSLLMPDEHNTTGEQENSRWPTLLHFAAEYNLSKLCEELLRYPSMIHAAVTENKDGLFPCQLAEKHGFTALQQRLLQYVENMRLRSAADSGVSIEHFPAPSPHTSQSHQYINSPTAESPGESFARDSLATYDDSYVDMTGFLPSYGYSKPRSYSDGNVKTPYARQPTESMIAEEDDAPPPLKPKTAVRSHSMCATSTSSRRSKSEPCEKSSDNDTDSSGESATDTLVNRNSEVPVLRDSYVHGEAPQASSRPDSHESSGSDYEVPPHQGDDDRLQVFSPEESPVLRSKHSKRSKTVQDKISHFFKKITARRQNSASESDLPSSAKSKLQKPVFYSRQSTSSNHSNQSDPTGYCPTHLKKSDSQRSSSSASNAENERDSGAVCDDHGSPVLLRSRDAVTSISRGSGKREGATTMDRRLSVRVQRAKKEEISETPTLPSRGSSDRQSGKGPGSSFVSFIR